MVCNVFVSFGQLIDVFCALRGGWKFVVCRYLALKTIINLYVCVCVRENTRKENRVFIFCDTFLASSNK